MSLHQPSPPVDSLVLYKTRPARVTRVGDKIEIEIEGGQTKRVRAKDLELLHPGPLRSLAALIPTQGEPEEAWALLEGGQTSLRELAELAFSEYTPATAWAAWELVARGLYFTGVPTLIQARGRAQVEQEQVQRAAKAAAERDWQELLQRLSAGRAEPRDGERLVEVERLALGRSERSRILAALGLEETPESAHRALIKIGHWPERHNPYPGRCGVTPADPQLPVPSLGEEPRLDLSGLAAFAIDDEGNQDPDDALSLDGDRLWVHVADVAALVEPDGALDREARARGSNLYAPEGVVNMLPATVTERLGLGLAPISPALSFALRCGEDGALGEVAVHRTWIRAQRLSYQEVEGRLGEEPFASIAALTRRYRARRLAQGAVSLDLPEVSLRVVEGEVLIRPTERLESRALVTDAMLMAGEGVARFCLERDIPIPFATQAPPDASDAPPGLAATYARRRGFKPTRLVLAPDIHAGLGLPIYTRATSPLRRYSDLLVHQQLRAWLNGHPLLSMQQVVERIGESELGAMAIRKAERLSNLHWKLVYLKEHPTWRGEAVVVAQEERRTLLLIPELALDARVRLQAELELDARVQVAIRDVDIPGQSAGFRVLG